MCAARSAPGLPSSFAVFAQSFQLQISILCFCSFHFRKGEKIVVSSLADGLADINDFGV